jgi:intein/homing endonuclease
MENQIILSGTAYYEFNHFAEYWKKWCKIIRSKGDHSRLKEIFNGEVPKNFKASDYSVIRLPYQLLPDGVMDEGQISRSKATIHSGIFDMEFGACLHPDVLITTDKGVKKIIDICVGDKVLTHKGRFRRVLSKTCLFKSGQILSFDTYGCFDNLLVTSEHPLYIGQDKFDPAVEISESLKLSCVKELSNICQIDLSDYVDNYIEMDDCIYPKSSRNLLSNEVIQSIKLMELDGRSVKDIALSTGVKEQNIYSLRYLKRPKRAIKKIVNLDFNLGLIFGYYLSEGSGSKDRSINFALDGHKDTLLLGMVDQLKEAIKVSFDTYTNDYIGSDNTTNVYICSRFIYQFIKRICPGICYNKIMRHDILFSNSEFMYGYVVGLFNGDGHKREEYACVTLSNLDAINQLRLVLSYFGIVSNIYKTTKQDFTIIKGKEFKHEQSYRLQIAGTNYDTFLREFFPDFSRKPSAKSCFLKYDGESIDSPIKKKEILEYTGLVYNLEVDEDNSYSTLNATVHNCFSKDSNGFFKRSLIEYCVPKFDAPIISKSGEAISFTPLMYGDKNKFYILGVDPASEVDKFSISVIELNHDHRRIVHQWTTDRKTFLEKRKQGKTSEDDFYWYAARKIRSLMEVFPCKHIAIDSQGGGIPISEALHNSKNLLAGEIPIWPMIDPLKEKPTDGESGLHILELCNFADSKWLSEANHGLRFDFEQRSLIFPTFDPLVIGLAAEQDMATGKENDTLEELIFEIEELKNELSIIEITQTASGKDKWDTPEIKTGVGRKGRLRKDRYSSLVMANMAGRQIQNKKIQDPYESYGGFSNTLSPNKPDNTGKMFIGPSWFTDKMGDVY